MNNTENGQIRAHSSINEKTSKHKHENNNEDKNQNNTGNGNKTNNTYKKKDLLVRY